MGCYQVSLGDTVGMGTPAEVGQMIEEVKKAVPANKLAVSLSPWRFPKT
jgi:hydroxymethylglutaryl-CoA lyase